MEPVDLCLGTVSDRSMLLSTDQSNETDGYPVSFDVIAAIADAEGVDPVEIEPPEYQPLYEVVNPEALDALFETRENGMPRTAGRIEFPYCGYHVVVSSDGEVDVSDAE